ncbi:hypothetical protein ILYODFUR_030934 [Ilyodon furcidens]|uniref:Uncharacterized protein n=1 Tax=Ilyodon furcidens TaxID=33524 RepID=A0ABV0T1P7_9TELE
MSVRVTMSSPVSSSFPVPLIVGPLCGIIFIILLLLLWRYRRFKDLCIRRISSESSCQSSTRDHGVNQKDSQVYSSLLHGDTSEYESIQPATNNGNPNDPQEDAVYTNI